MFVSAPENSKAEIHHRRDAKKNLLKFGISFLDDALIGIRQSDLILLGASSGIGKTELCCNIALANLEAGKRIHYIALEAEEFEIERRLKYQLVASAYFGDEDRPKLDGKLSFDRWLMGDFLEPLQEYELRAAKFFEAGYKNLFLFYKREKYGLPDLIEQVVKVGPETDLIIVDHVHYFDFDDDNENRAMREIAKTARTLALEEQKPIILVSHLRKRDRNNQDLVPGLEEFHGSSDLFKIATKVITMAPGAPTDNGNFETFIRIPKNRFNGSVTRFLGRLLYNPKVNRYEKQYKIGLAGLSRESGFEELEADRCPDWATHSGEPSGRHYPVAQRQLPFPAAARRTGPFTRVFKDD